MSVFYYATKTIVKYCGNICQVREFVVILKLTIIDSEASFTVTKSELMGIKCLRSADSRFWLFLTLIPTYRTSTVKFGIQIVNIFATAKG